jgi:hypothetical protein
MRVRSDRTRGQALVEFAFVLPVFMLLLFGMVDLGRIVWANNSLGNAAREGARFAIVHGGSKATECPVGPPSLETVIPAASGTCPYPSPSRQAIRDQALRYAFAGGEGITVQVCYGAGCSGDTDTAGATNARGTLVTVRVTSTVSPLTAALVGQGPFQVSAESTMLINH